MQEKLNRLEEIRIKTNELYTEKYALEKEIIQHFLDNKENFNEIELEEHIATLKWVYEKEIDYKKMEELYPEIYVLGLLPQFSKKQLLKVVDKEQARIILKECTYDTSHYKTMLKNKKKRRYRKKVEKEE